MSFSRMKKRRIPAVTARPTTAPRPGPARSIASGRSPKSAAPSSAPVAKLTRCGRNLPRAAAGKRSTAPATAALAMPPRVVKARIQPSTVKVYYLACAGARIIVARRSRAAANAARTGKPHERRHPPARRVAPEREKPHRVAVRTEPAAKHPLHPEDRQALPRERKEVALPAAARICRKSERCALILRQERRAHLLSDLEGGRSDRRSEPRAKLARRDAEGAHGSLKHPACKPAPAAMRGSDRRAIPRREEHRQTVSHLYRADASRDMRDGSVGAPGARRAIKIRDLRPMHLLEPRRLGGQFKKMRDAPAILLDRPCVIAHVPADVERIKRRPAHPTGAQRKSRPDLCKDRPLRSDE